MYRKSQRLIWAGIFLLLGLSTIVRGQQRRDKQELLHPEEWVKSQGNRMQQELPYLAEANPQTAVKAPLKSRIWQKKFVVSDVFRGEMLRIERKKDYVVVQVQTHDDKGHKGRITVGGPIKLEFRKLVLFYGQKKAFGSYFLYDEIRAFNDPDVENFPVVVLRFTGPDTGVAYLDPLASGSPQAIVNFASAPAKN